MQTDSAENWHILKPEEVFFRDPAEKSKKIEKNHKT
jgi:hypothetical protein